MKIETIKYTEYLNQIPRKGNYIIGQQTEKEILVYQAFNNNISDYAVENQKFGGSHYSFSRMTWIKPNFLWMMYRCGWAKKENQERVLGIWIKKEGFLKILHEAVYSSYNENVYLTKENWKKELKAKTVRLQWDPDHDIHGNKQERRAIQLGLKSRILSEFNQEMVSEIIDITKFVKEQKSKIEKKEYEYLEIPKETVFKTFDNELNRKLELEKEHSN